MIFSIKVKRFSKFKITMFLACTEPRRSAFKKMNDTHQPNKLLSQYKNRDILPSPIYKINSFLTTQLNN